MRDSWLRIADRWVDVARSELSLRIEVGEVFEVVMAVVGLILSVVSAGSLATLVRCRRLAPTRGRRRLAQTPPTTATVTRIRTELEEQQSDGGVRNVVTFGLPRARVLPPFWRAIDDEVRLLEAVETLVYDPAVWERPSTTS